ncbi:cytochrome c maturation protein CcmE [Salinibacterium sp. SYSU T00001]|uniref:cytochrome c maturation protein CcmE n=1 Tax=Homoserinimonas sedimenticola TaxID=2986805 RepID=UPI002235620D|nr:cytochrome c maturation protein CcmE [Salinibacterium sedimenticola]MCW4384779.1 cytochrome c maturation protein CcmE [Salinibacterium sedimenticola]
MNGARRRLSIAALVAASLGLGAVGLLANDGALIYYRTPTEAVAEGYGDGLVRVGGLVVVGSVREAVEESTLVITDGVTRVRVAYPGRFPDSVREGEGAVVEGRWTRSGVLLGEQLLFRHSNEYRPPSQ